jgi:hypothetical protein
VKLPDCQGTSVSTVVTEAREVLERRHAWVEAGIADRSGEGPMIAEQTEEVRAAAHHG